MKEIILASASPRRKEILSMFVDEFQIIPAKNEVEIDASLSVTEAVKKVAYYKALEVFEQNRDKIVIGSDTSVLINSEFLGKPKDRNDAFRMLRLLSGNVHQVLTAVCIMAESKEICFCETVQVEFCNLTDEEINEYLYSGEPFDKAGAYGIQGKGGKFVKRIDGDFFSVMGLPCSRTYQELKNFAD